MGFIKRLMHLYFGITVAGVIVVVLYVLRANVSKKLPIKYMFLVDTPSCRIHNLDPFDKSIIKLINVEGKIICGGKPSITYEDGDMIRINWTTVKNNYSDLKSCKYQPIIRGPKKSDSSYKYGDLKELKPDSKIRNDFIKIVCINESGETVYTNFHTFVIPKADANGTSARNLKDHIENNKPKEVMNVMMIGVDSLSRLNFMRQMPLTRKYLLDDLEAVEMLGYTKVADNTFVNIVPMTIGKFVEELPWNETKKNEPFDEYGFIWKNFSQSGYRTMYSEDAPGIAIFNYLKKGFHEQPTDHYNRAFSLALEKEKSLWRHGHHCVGDRLETDIVLNYARQFSTTYQHSPHFGFTFITRLTHGGAAGKADDPYFRFLQRIHRENLLKNTVLIFFSDHGMRFGKIRKTYVGKLEERMPFMFLVFPRWFKDKYPQVLSNMETNSGRLTTPFDIHETLTDLLHFTGKVRQATASERGISLFNEIPSERTCENAGILPHWCMCLDSEDLSKSSEYVNSSVNLVLGNINQKLLHYRDICEVLELQEIQKATKMVANNNVLRFEKSVNVVINRTVHLGQRAKTIAMLQITIVTAPGEGMFEATVKYDEANNVYTMAGDISRINKYGSQSHCIDNFVLKKYCFCKKEP